MQGLFPIGEDSYRSGSIWWYFGQSDEQGPETRQVEFNVTNSPSLYVYSTLYYYGQAVDSGRSVRFRAQTQSVYSRACKSALVAGEDNMIVQGVANYDFGSFVLSSGGTTDWIPILLGYQNNQISFQNIRGSGEIDCRIRYVYR